MVLWSCPKDSTHIWKTSPHNRSTGNGCPVCGAKGWDRPRLAHFLSSQLAVFTLPGQNEATRRKVFKAAGALYTSGRQRSIIEAIISGELSNEDIVSYIAGEDSSNVQTVIARHRNHLYGGKERIPRKTQAQVHERDGHACLACETTSRLTCDHYPTPESMGGKAVLENLRTLCLVCNCVSWTKALSIEEIRERRGLPAST
jgi:hypothetical protein